MESTATPAERFYNIALRPQDPAIDRLFVEAAQIYAETADSYLLGVDALPHVTLCMFHAASHEIATETFANWSAERTLAIILGQFHVVEATDKQNDKVWWTQIDAERDPILIDLQRSCYNHLTSQGFKPLQAPETYKPHFTFSRRRTPFEEKRNPVALSPGRIVKCRVEIGECSEVGVFIRPLSAPTP